MMKRIIAGVLLFFVLCVASAYAHGGGYEYRKIVPLVIVNQVGHAIGLYVNHEFVDYVLPGERFVYNFAVFSGEKFPVYVHASVGYHESGYIWRTIRYGTQPTRVVFTKKNFGPLSVGYDREQTVLVTIANETHHKLEIWYEGKPVKVCEPFKAAAIRVRPGIIMIRSLRLDHSRYLKYEIFISNTFIIKDSDFWFP